MSYWDSPEYIEEAKYPEIDAEINTLIEHLVDSIKEEAIDNIAKTSDAYQNLKASYENLRRELTKTQGNVVAKENMIKLLQKELEKKKTEHPAFKYNIGDKVFYIQPDYRYNKKVFCPRCHGKGIVSLAEEGCNLPDDLKESTISCPECRNSTGGILYHGAKHFKERDCTEFYAATGFIDTIEYALKSDGTSSSMYIIKTSSDNFYKHYEEDLFENQEEANQKAKQKTRLVYIEACKGVGIEPEPEGN